MLSLTADVAAALTPGPGQSARVYGSDGQGLDRWSTRRPEEQPTEQPRQTTAAYFGGPTRTLASRQEPSLDVGLMTRDA
jgi:hypothetical protein